MAPSAPPRPASAPLPRLGGLLAAAALALAGLWTLRPVLSGGWLWDDGQEVTQNWILQGSGGPGRFWTAPPGPDYFPVKDTLEWLEWRLFGPAPAGYHAVSLALHLLSALLLWRILRGLFAEAGLAGAGACGWLGGLLFAVHPLAVESAAWAAELKNTLSLFLMLAALLAYEGHDRKGRALTPQLALALLLFLLALLAKTSVVMLPFVLLLLCWWRRGRITRRDLAGTAPFFAAALVLGLLTLRFQRASAIGAWDIEAGSPLARLEHSASAVGFYAVKFIAPAGLLPLYSRWGLDAPHAGYLAAALALAGAAAWAWVRRRTWGRHALLGIGFLVLNLLPSSGLAAMAYMRYARVADHFAYIALAGAAGLAAAGAGLLARKAGRPFAVGAATAIVILLAAISHRYAAVFHDSESLWSYAVARDPLSWAAHYNLGRAEVDRGRVQAGVEQYVAALKLRPGLAELHNNLGYALMLEGRLPQAEAQVREALRRDPADARSHVNLGNLLDRKGDVSGAIAEEREALRLAPALADAQFDLANYLAQAGRIPEALEHYRAAAALDPRSVEGRFDWALALASSGRLEEAAGQLRIAVGLAPGNPLLWSELGGVLAELRRLPEAERCLAQAVRLNPRAADAEANLGEVLLLENRPAEAEPHLENALRLDPSLAGARRALERARQLGG